MRGHAFSARPFDWYAGAHAVREYAACCACGWEGGASGSTVAAARVLHRAHVADVKATKPGVSLSDESTTNVYGPRRA